MGYQKSRTIPGQTGPERRCSMSSMQPLEFVSRASRLDRILLELLQQTPGVEAAAVVSFDGLPMASALPAGMDEDRVAAMSAALLSLGERAAENFGRGSLTQVYVEGENGTVFLVSADDEAVLESESAVGGEARFDASVAVAVEPPLELIADLPAEPTPVEQVEYVE